MYGNWLYYISRDNFLISLDATTGAQRWIQPVSDPKQYYFSTMAPLVIGDHVIIGTGGDSLDLSGFVQARDPETGEIQWTHYNTPRAGEPGIETWPDAYASTHGGGGTWVQGAYDPELNLYYYGTANPNPVYAPQSRKGADLYTSSIIAINPDTGKMAWYFQVSPHDTHDWDAACDMVLIDGTIDGKPRKLLAHASRNGYFVVLDRTNGKSIVTVPFIDKCELVQGPRFQRTAHPGSSEGTVARRFTRMAFRGQCHELAAAEFQPTDRPVLCGERRRLCDFLSCPTRTTIPKATAEFRAARAAIPARSGRLITERAKPFGNMCGLPEAAPLEYFQPRAIWSSRRTGDNLIAFNATNGKILWHSQLLSAPNAPMTYMMDGKQYVFVIAGETLYSFVLNQPAK